MIGIEKYNFLAAWIGIALGVASGIPMGLFFHKEDWLGGYGSWERRLVRLGHISFFGIAFLNIAFAVTVVLLQLDGAAIDLPARMFIAAQITMPLTCFAAAFWKPARHLFFVPVASALGGAASFVWVLRGALL